MAALIRGASLKPRCRTIVRNVADGEPITEKQAAWMVAMGLGTKGGKLTEKGRRVHREIMRSGDGPESLKEMFRF